MPRNRLGQMITFSIELDEDMRRTGYIWVDVRRGDTIRKIAARRGHPEEAPRIAKLNNVRSTRKVLHHHPKKKSDKNRIRVPGQLRQADMFHVLAGNGAPTVTQGYAKLDTIDRPERTGLTSFTGYDPILMTVPVRFDWMTGRTPQQIERDIDLLERMAGRGDVPGAAVGPPAVIRLSTTNNQGQVVPLIPLNYQWSQQNPSAPLWRIASIEWDEEPLRNDNGLRIRQLATVTVQQHTRVSFAVRSSTKRNKDKAKTSKKKDVKKTTKRSSVK